MAKNFRGYFFLPHTVVVSYITLVQRLVTLWLDYLMFSHDWDAWFISWSSWTNQQITCWRPLFQRFVELIWDLCTNLQQYFLRATAYAVSVHMLSQFRPSVCPSVCLSHGWISQKRLKVGSCNFHHTVAPSLYLLRTKFHPEILTGSPSTEASNKGGVGKIRNFQPITCRISETVQDRTKVTIND